MARIEDEEQFEGESSSPMEEDVPSNERADVAPASTSCGEEGYLHPSAIFPLQPWLTFLTIKGRDYGKFLNLGSEYKFRMPAGMDCTSFGLVEGEFAVYGSFLKLGMRFPPHPFVVELLDGFNIGLNQMSPNSWAGVFGYIARCELAGITPSFPA